MKNKTNYSRIIAGTMTWGTWGKAFSKKEAIKAIHHCVAQGLTTFDHADIYGDYTTEAAFGNAFAESTICREKIQLISKCGIQMLAGRSNKVAHYQYSKEYIVFSVEESLKKLRTDYLDLLLLHRPSPLIHPAEISEAILKLREDGKIKDFGVSNFTPSQIGTIATATPVCANQFEFSLTKNDAMYNGVLDDCVINKRMAMAWSPLGGYFNASGAQKERIAILLEKLREKYKAGANTILLAWLLRHPAQVHPVIGTTDKGRIADAARSVSINMEIEDWFMLLKASRGHDVA